MAIATLSTISTYHFKGGRYLTGSSSNGLAAQANVIIAKINEIIAGMVDLDTLEVGTVGGGTYYGSSDSWMSIDGTNAPTFSRIRLLDETTGLYVQVRANAGVLEVI